jgi:hypothetical protein
MLKQPIYVEFNLDAKVNNSKLIAISHVDDKYSETLEVAVKQNDRFVYMGGASVVARMVLHREKDYLLSDSVPCTVNDNGNILIPFDNAVVKTLQGTVKIEVNITRDTDELTLQFPLWVSVKGSILDGAEVTPESEGTIPDLLKEAKEALGDAQAALTRVGDYNNLENKPLISGVTLSGNKTPDELGLQKTLTAGEHISIDASTGTISVFEVAGYKIVFESQNDRCTEDGTIYSTSIDGQPAVMFVRNSTTYITQFALVKGGKLIWRTQQAETSWQPAGEWSAWQEIGGGSKIASGVVNQNGTISFYDADGNLLFTTTGASVIGPQGEPGTDYVLTDQDKTDIANIVLQELPTTEGVLYGNASN